MTEVMAEEQKEHLFAFGFARGDGGTRTDDGKKKEEESLRGDPSTPAASAQDDGVGTEGNRFALRGYSGQAPVLRFAQDDTKKATLGILRGIQNPHRRPLWRSAAACQWHLP